MNDKIQEYEELRSYLNDYRNNLVQKSVLVSNTLEQVDDGREDPRLDDLRNRKAQLDADIAHFDAMFARHIDTQ